MAHGAYPHFVEAREDRFVWMRRLRWRLRGASQAPAFVVFTLLDTAVLQVLPFSGDRGPGLVATFILAGFMNLVVVAVVAPLGGMWLRHRDEGLPGFAAADRAAVAALAGLCALLVLGGLLHRPAVEGEAADMRAQAAAAQRYFLAAGHGRSLGRMTSWKAGEDLYRTCVPGPDPGRHLCVYVTTDESPPGIVRDPSQEPNSVVAGTANPGARVR